MTTDNQTHAVCDNCGHYCADEDLKNAKDLGQRLDPGSVVPAGECPKCGALSYPTPVLKPDSCHSLIVLKVTHDGLTASGLKHIQDILTRNIDGVVAHGLFDIDDATVRSWNVEIHTHTRD
jgi:hypothetical protein